ncbi:hypothetical protein E2C01_065234 [Portunus trituberculatus]|uniref:Uncharacterized protein n=1 Tax=Portunus trituberculatus TaxID=210409 RepID=A0A5B7HMG5_PORTR|nr:hypothetical protein [Portunus trituberculatus]
MNQLFNTWYLQAARHLHWIANNSLILGGCFTKPPNISGRVLSIQALVTLMIQSY